MAEKENNSTKNTAKTTVKVTAKPEAKPTTSTAPKTTVTATPAATIAPKPTTTATAKPATPTAAKPAATTAPKTTVTAKPAATPAAKPTTTATAKPATTTATKPAATPAPKTTATATPATPTAAKPATTAKPEPAATAKPAATTAPKTTAPAANATAPKAAATTKSAPVEAKPKVAAVKVEDAERTEKVKKEKPVKAVKATEGGGSSAKAKVAAIVRTDNFKIFGIIALSLIMVLCLSLGLVFGLKSCSLGMQEILGQDPITVNKYAQATLVGYSSETVGTVERNKPVEGVHDEQDAFPIGGLNPAKRYPTYGSTPKGYTGEANVAVRQAIVNESAYLCAWGTRGANRGGEQTPDKYTKIDKDGWLYQYKDGQWIHSLVKTADGYGTDWRRLYKHSASVGLYLGDVSDNEPGIVKQVKLRPRGYSSYSVTGVYAPAGEVIKIQLSGADMNATGGITIHIGQALYNGQANNIWVGKNTMPRMAHVLTTLAINKSTAEYDEATDTWTGYVGSFLGGPIYVRNTTSTVNVTISGGCAYRHFILGYTSEAEFAELSKSSVPYFDLEVWDKGVLHSGPLRYAQSFSYDALYKAAVLWEKVSLVSTTNGTKQGIVFIYDPFVAAGAAVAFPGRSSVNCPLGWMSQSLNYEKIVTSGSWGNFHEYNHNFQNYGMGYTGEVTNNGLNLVAYSLFTNISSSRRIAGYGASGLSDWNRYTSATWSLYRVNGNAVTSTNGLSVYATLLHNLGQDAFIKSRGATGTNNYLNKWATTTHQDFSYYGDLVSTYSGTYTPSAAVTNANYPLFVPVASVYQTGRTYMYDGEKREINTMQPYVIPYGQSFTVDLNPYTVNGAGQYQSGSVVIGNGFSYKIKSVNADGINGTFVKSGDGVYTFTPNSELRSGKIRVTIEIYNEADGTREYNGHKLDDVDLILEFQQSHETNKHVLERTVYTYDAANMISDARAAFESNFGQYNSVKTIDHSNPTQNSNTDIWYWPTTTGHEAYLETHPEYFATDNAIHVIDGKLYFSEDGKYRVYLRGRYNCAVYYSLDGKNYSLGAYINDTSDSAGFRLNDPNTYFDVEFADNFVYFNSSTNPATSSFSGDNWLYIKEILIAQTSIPSSAKASYIGLGLASWITPAYSADVKYYIDGTSTELKWSDADERYSYTSGGVTYYVESDGTRYHYVDIEKVTDTSVTIMTQTIYTDLITNKTVDEKDIKTEPIEPTGTPAYATAYRRTYDFKKEFVSDYFYTRSYNYNLVGTPQIYSTWDEGVRIVSNNKADAGEAYKIENLLKEGTDTYFHSASNANYSKGTMVLELDMGKQITANSITFLGRTPNAATTAHQALPYKFSLEISMDGETYTSAGDYENSGIRNNRQVTVTLNDTYEFRYVKITINSTWSNNKHFVYSGIYFTYTFTLNGNGDNFYSPDNAMFTYKGNWEVKNCDANFGHVYVGNNGTMEFEFDGTRFAIFASDLYNKNYVVTIDGEVYESADLTYLQNVDKLSYLTPKLSEGKHKVVIYCPDGGNIDAIATW